MLHILLVSARPDMLEVFAGGLSSDPDVFLEQAGSKAEAMGIVLTKRPQLVIVDSGLPDAGPLDLVREIVHADATVNTAVVSPLPDEEFHEKSEGLGILCSLPLEPGVYESAVLLAKLRGLLGPAN